MSWFDLAFAVLIVTSIVSGIRRGFSGCGFGFLAVIAAFFTAAWFYPANPKGFVVVFAGLICVAVAGAFLLGRWFRATGLKWLDGLLGATLGLTNALLFTVFAVLALMAFAPDFSGKYVAGSRLAPHVIDSAYALSELVPDEMRTQVERSYQELGNALPLRYRKSVPPLPSREI